MKFSINDVTLSVVVEGDERAPAVLLLHGFPDSSKIMVRPGMNLFDR